jgi:hypothetical protein
VLASAQRRSGAKQGASVLFLATSSTCVTGSFSLPVALARASPRGGRRRCLFPCIALEFSGRSSCCFLCLRYRVFLFAGGSGSCLPAGGSAQVSLSFYKYSLGVLEAQGALFGLLCNGSTVPREASLGCWCWASASWCDYNWCRRPQSFFGICPSGRPWAWCDYNWCRRPQSFFGICPSGRPWAWCDYNWCRRPQSFLGFVQAGGLGHGATTTGAGGPSLFLGFVQAGGLGHGATMQLERAASVFWDLTKRAALVFATTQLLAAGGHQLFSWDLVCPGAFSFAPLYNASAVMCCALWCRSDVPALRWKSLSTRVVSNVPHGWLIWRSTGGTPCPRGCAVLMSVRRVSLLSGDGWLDGLPFCEPTHNAVSGVVHFLHFLGLGCSAARGSVYSATQCAVLTCCSKMERLPRVKAHQGMTALAQGGVSNRW